MAGTEHLFFDCLLVIFVWNVACCSFGFEARPLSVFHLYSDWLKLFLNKDRALVLVGVAAILWSIWKTRNEACFQGKRPDNLVTVTNLIGFWISPWAILQSNEGHREGLCWGAKLFKQASSEVFTAARVWQPANQQLAS